MTSNEPKWWMRKKEDMPKAKYTNISVPESLRLEVEKLFETLDKEGIGLGYVSFSDFARDAIRRRLEEIRATYLNEKK